MRKVLVAHQVLGLEDAEQVGFVDCNGHPHEQHLGRFLQLVFDGIAELTLLQRPKSKEIKVVVPVVVYMRVYPVFILLHKF